jgi:hypothetical protein
MRPQPDRRAKGQTPSDAQERSSLDRGAVSSRHSGTESVTRAALLPCEIELPDEAADQCGTAGYRLRGAKHSGILGAELAGGSTLYSLTKSRGEGFIAKFARASIGGVLS